STETICLKAINKYPNPRYQSTKDLLFYLRHLQLPSSALCVRPLTPSHWKRAWTEISYAIAGLLALLALLAGLNVGSLRNRLLGHTLATKVFASQGWILIADPENLTGQEFFDKTLREGLTIG